MSLRKGLGWGIAGAAVAPFLEYAWHAWVAHGRRADPTRTAHLEHHRTAHSEGDAWQEIRENAARVGKTTLLLAGALTPVLGLAGALPFAGALAASYVAITLSHARMHVRAPRGPAEEWMWRFHFHHHYGNPRANYGLTSPLFDYVFHTAEAPVEVTLPRDALPSWWTGEAHGFRVASNRASVAGQS
ncbi:MAG: sterol desaturase family protein [Polyangiaceae bacterium]